VINGGGGGGCRVGCSRWVSLCFDVVLWVRFMEVVKDCRNGGDG